MSQREAAPGRGRRGAPDALILAGGLGRRLRSLLPDRPKVLAPVAGRPFLAYLLDRLESAGLERVILCTGYKGEQVARAIGTQWGRLEVLYSREERPLGTAGALRRGARLASSPELLVLNGDSCCRADLSRYLAWYREHSRPAAMLLTRVEDARRYGSVRVDGTGRVVGFEEKGKDRAGPAWINAGVYLLARRLVASLPAVRPLSLEREVLPCWVGRELMGWTGGGEFIDIGTPDSYGRAAAFFGREVSV